MKKTIAVLCAAVGAILFAFAGCSGADNFTEKVYHSGDIAIERVDIQVTDRALEIGASEDGQVHIEYYDSEKEYLDIASENGRLTVELVLDKDWTDFIGIKPAAEYRKIVIQVPDDKMVNITADTTNEDIKVTSLSLIESLHSNGGSIVCERVNVGQSLDLTAKNGDITGTVVGSWDDFAITCSIKKGDCNLPLSKEGGSKSFTADCNNGNIDIEFVR